MKGTPLLTVKEERFAQLLAMADISQTAAYIDAGYSPKQLRKTIWEAASRLAANSKVVARVNEIRATAAEAAGVTKPGHLTELAKIRNMALEGDKTAAGNIVKNYGAAVAAEIARGKHSGVAAPDKHQDVIPDIPVDEAITELCTQNGIVHETARRIFMHGLEVLKTPYHIVLRNCVGLYPASMYAAVWDMSAIASNWAKRSSLTVSTGLPLIL